MERGRLRNVPRVAPTLSRTTTTTTTLPFIRRRRKCTFRLLVCLLVVTVLHVNVPGVRSIKSHSLRTDSSARRRPANSKQQASTTTTTAATTTTTTTTTTTIRADNNEEDNGGKASGSNYLIHRRKKAFRFAQLLPVSWTFLSQRRRNTALLPLASTTESESTTSVEATAAVHSSEAKPQPQPQSQSQPFQPQSQSSSSTDALPETKTLPSAHLQLQELAAVGAGAGADADANAATTSNPKDDTEPVPHLPSDGSNSNSNTNDITNAITNTNTTTTTNTNTNTTTTTNTKQQQQQHTTVKIHTFQDFQTGHTWKALNTHKTKFYAFLKHQNCTLTRSDITTNRISLSADNEEDEEDVNNKQLRQEWRMLWKQRRLVTDRTELLAVYPSDKAATAAAASTTATEADQKVAQAAKLKRGGFADLLYLYTERLVSIIRDEQVEVNQTLTTSSSSSCDHTEPQEQQHTNTNTNINSSSSADSDESMLMDWLRSSYGKDLTEQLRAGNLGLLEETEQLGHLKHFLEWFRSQFPYYYDRCGTCGASMKEDNARHPPLVNHRDSVNDVDSGDDQEEQDEHQTFVGYIYPDEVELQGKASRTEMYHCHKCESFTRFPRYNSVTHVIENHRGRCGEYSMLLYRMLRALDHEARWVVDWADHVWAEVALGGGGGGKQGGTSLSSTARRWVHLDPCEAAVDENFIYQGWGKKQTYILGFYAPPQRGAGTGTDDTDTDIGSSSDPLDLFDTTLTTPIIEDITATYTTDSWDDICKRRDESEDEIRASMAKAIGELAPKLLNVGEDRHD
jgi:hypothetical protein